MALFNEAQLLGRAKKVDEALALYVEALKINPASKEVKTNIELLIPKDQENQSGKDDKKDQDQKDKKDDQKKDPKDDKKDDKKDPSKDDKKNDKKDPKGDKDKDKEKEPDKPEDKKDEKDPKPEDKDQKKDKPKEYGQNPKPQPKKFDSKELNEGDVKKILQELKQQEQKIRAEFNRKEAKEQPRDKDW
ncbi:MAG: hypothetical protein EOP06_13550 [Proteobacteria bacterium]|nr:MAG: hypothetical protein EOP06_13550 [Pseudomonadota bacterium]